MTKQRGINAKAWFYSQSFHSNIGFTPSTELRKTIEERNAAFRALESAPANERTPDDYDDEFWRQRRIDSGKEVK